MLPATIFPHFPLLTSKRFKPFFKKLIYYFWLCWVYIVASRLSVAAASGALVRRSFSSQWLLLLRSTALGPQAAVAVAPGLSCSDVESFQARTCVPYPQFLPTVHQGVPTVSF